MRQPIPFLSPLFFNQMNWTGQILYLFFLSSLNDYTSNVYYKQYISIEQRRGPVLLTWAIKKHARALSHWHSQNTPYYIDYTIQWNTKQPKCNFKIQIVLYIATNDTYFNFRRLFIMHTYIIDSYKIYITLYSQQIRAIEVFSAIQIGYTVLVMLRDCIYFTIHWIYWENCYASSSHRTYPPEIQNRQRRRVFIESCINFLRYNR